MVSDTLQGVALHGHPDTMFHSMEISAESAHESQMPISMRHSSRKVTQLLSCPWVLGDCDV